VVKIVAVALGPKIVNSPAVNFCNASVSNVVCRLQHIAFEKCSQFKVRMHYLHK
jgi:hypothetical protein